VVTPADLIGCTPPSPTRDGGRRAPRPLRLADVRIAALALGTVLLLVAALAPFLPGSSVPKRGRTWARAGAALAGVALLGWGLSSFLGPQAPYHPAPVATSLPTEAPVDLVDVASIALQDCARATAPSVPDGATATREQMTAARSDFQAYDTATNSYVHCVDTAIERIARQYAAVASPADLKSLKAFGLGAHDTAIDQEQAFADQLNAQIRTYRAKHPQS
jgi:hypothetical protein